VAVKLARAGYGTPGQILDEPLENVLTMLEYEKFIPEYEERFMEMNKHDSG
jgi:hypothetical protein